MKAKLHLVFSISIFFISFYAHAQQSYWKSIPKQSNFKSVSIGDIAKAGAVFELDDTVFSKGLERTMASMNQGHVVYLPNYDGKVIAFALKETPVFHPDLTKKYPGIRSFSGISLDGNYSVKLSSSQKGLQSMIVNLKDRETSFMEPLANRAGGYVVYEKGSSTNKDGFVCDTEKLQQSVSRTIVPLVNDQLLRGFRIAVSTTGEYTDFHGGTKAGALAAINATLTRVNGIFETDLGVRLELIANNDDVIFTDASTDPYTSNLNSQVQNTLTSIIGEANYDVGHLFDRVPTAAQNNGNAGKIGSVCSDNKKGSAFSSTSMPKGDVFDVDFVAHELGHQFGANHTWSFESEGTRVQVQAEPGSGTTIMGYAGITGGNDVAPNSDDYFHFNSVQQIVNYLGTVRCAQTTVLTNSPPVVTPMGDYSIPKGTAFVLEGAATDADVSDVLTYTWEQVDDGVVTNTTFGPNNASGANFRSLPPTTDPARYFPRLSRVVSGNLTQTNPTINEAWETVSNIERDLNFAFTVRDNATGGGQLVSDLLKVEVLNSAGPFTVTSQASSEVYDGGSIQEITWDVANTNVLPINAQRVDIFLSLDGGLTFPITLADDVLNDGSEEVLFPGNATSTARIMVKASDNVFFAVNASDFTIQETNVVLSFQELSYQVCQPNDVIIPFTYQTFSGFSQTSTFSADLPAGLSAAFSPTQASANDTAVDLTISGINAVSPGTYPITVTSTSMTQNVELTLVINDGNFSDITLLAPTDAQTDVSIRTGLSWEANDLYTEYDVEIATDVGFASIVESATVPFNFYQATNLIEETEYFWRVRPKNNCGTGTFSSPFRFTTIQLDCTSAQPNDLPLEISKVGTSTISSKIQFPQDLPIADVNVNLQLSHTFLSDLIIDLIAPSGTRVTLISTNCDDLENLNAVFDDDGTDIVCSGNPAISGTVSPLGSLTSLIGESALGEWTLEIRDVASGDGGALETFELELCVEGALRPDDDGDGVFDDGDDFCSGTPPGVEVDVKGCAVKRLPADNFTIQIGSETCRDNNNDDGFVSISAVDTSLTYTAVLDGNGNTLNMDFTDSDTFGNLSAGSYSLCMTGTDGTTTYQETCFSINVAEPELLSASAVMASGVLEVTLSGASLYNVELNGLVTQTEESNIALNLKEGLNTLRVFTNLPCQGSYENSFFFSSTPILYPNPVETTSNVFLNGFVGDVEVQVFTSNGRLIMNEMKRANGTDLEVDFSSLPTGIYYMKIQSTEVRKEFKLIKE